MPQQTEGFQSACQGKDGLEARLEVAGDSRMCLLLQGSQAQGAGPAGVVAAGPKVGHSFHLQLEGKCCCNLNLEIWVFRNQQQFCLPVKLLHLIFTRCMQ